MIIAAFVADYFKASYIQRSWHDWVDVNSKTKNSEVAVLIEPMGALGESLCHALFRRGAKLVLVSDRPNSGIFSERLAVEGIEASWRFVSTDLDGSMDGLFSDLSQVYGQVNSLTSFFPANITGPAANFLGQSATSISKLIEPQFRSRLKLMQTLMPLVTRTGIAINLHVGLRGRPDYQRGLRGHVAHLIDDLLSTELTERDIACTHIATAQGSLMEVQRDLEHILAVLGKPTN